MKDFLSKTSTAIGGSVIILLLAGSYAIFGSHHVAPKNFVTVQTGSISQQVRETGTVQAAEDIDLSFQKAGKIESISVKVGDKVKSGQQLMRIDTKDASAAIDQARAAVLAAQANYNKVIDGSSSSDVQIAQVAVTNAQTNLTAVTKQQQTIVNNAQAAVFNAGLAAIPVSGNTSTSVPTITGTYNSTVQGEYDISLYQAGDGAHFNYSGLESGTSTISQGVPEPLGTHGLFITFSSGSLNSNDRWTVSIPNTSASGYLAANNSYQAALQAQSSAVSAAQGALDSANAALAAKQAQARPEDVQAAQAQVAAAQASLEAANNVYSNSVITAPFDGTVTSVDGNLGETVDVNQNVAKIVSNAKYEINADVSEADIGKIKVGDAAAVTLDAYGSENFDATVTTIDLSAHMDGNVSAYKVTLQFNNDDARIRSGMNANMVITDQSKDGVLIVPSQDIFTSGDNKYVTVDAGNGKTAQQQVQLGLVGLDNVEVTSGLQAGQRIVDFGK